MRHKCEPKHLDLAPQRLFGAPRIVTRLDCIPEEQDQSPGRRVKPMIRSNDERQVHRRGRYDEDHLEDASSGGEESLGGGIVGVSNVGEGFVKEDGHLMQELYTGLINSGFEPGIK